MARSILQRTLAGLAMVGLGVLVALWLALTGWYWLGSRDLGAFAPSAATYPEEARLALWRGEGGTGAPVLPRYSPTTYAWTLWRERMERRASPDRRVLEQLAMHRAPSSGTTLHRFRGRFAAVVRASRDWSPTQVLDSLLDAMYFGGEAQGLRAGADRVFGQDPDTLSRAELDVLMVVARAPRHFDPWCERERVQASMEKLDPQLDAAMRDAALAMLAPQPADVACR